MTTGIIIAGIASVIIAATVVAASRLEPRGTHHRDRLPEPQPYRYTARVIADAREIHHDQLLPFPGLLELEPVPPPAETGELPALTSELGADFDDYWAGLVTTGPQQATT